MKLGADIEGLTNLGTQFKSTGETFKGNFEGIGQRARNAEETLVTDMKGLVKEAVAIRGNIDDKLTALTGKFGGSDWTGKVGEQAKSAYDSTRQDLVTQLNAMDEFVQAALGVVTGSLAPFLESFDTNVKKFGTASDLTTASFQKGIVGQASAFSAVFDGV